MFSPSHMVGYHEQPLRPPPPMVSPHPSHQPRAKKTCSSNWSHFPHMHSHPPPRTTQTRTLLIVPMAMASHSLTPPLPLTPLLFFFSLSPCPIVSFPSPSIPCVPPPFYLFFFLVPPPACPEGDILPILEQQQQQDSMGYLTQGHPEAHF